MNDSEHSSDKATSLNELDSLIEEALERPANEQTAYLRSKCGDSPDLYREVVSLLKLFDQAEEALGESAAAYAAPLWASSDKPVDGTYAEDDIPAGTQIGPYLVLEKLGSGGMGSVYLAERADGMFRKKVALKFVKRGMDTDDMIRRFARERQILARLDHPGIARILDAGAAKNGRPYLVMEYVKGVPITDFVKQNKLSAKETIALIEQMCLAVSYAHRRLVIHRDLKPSNILVTEDEAGQAQIKLLDFGIARILDPEEDDELTRTGVRPVTPKYAAPEQIRGESVTTAADGYSLGVVMLILLTGRSPSFSRKSLGEVAKDVRLLSSFKGDLETIVSKAIREEADERYLTVEALLDDLRRHKDGLPINARPTSAAYRLRKFVDRHRVGVVAAGFVLMALVAGLGVALWQADVAAQERDRAETAAQEAAHTAAFLESLFKDTDPSETIGDTLTAVSLLDRGRERLADEFADTPLLHAHMLRVVADAYRNMDDPSTACGLLEEALRLQQQLLGVNDLETLDTQSQLASALYYTGDYAEARRLFDDWLARMEALPDDGSLAYAHQLARQGNLLYYRSRHVEAKATLRRAHSLFLEHNAMAEHDARVVLTQLVQLHLQEGEFDEAELLVRDQLQHAQEQEDLRAYAYNLNKLAEVYHGQGHHSKAHEACSESLSSLEQLDSRNQGYGNALFVCGDILVQQGNLDEGERLFDRAEEIMRNRLAENSPAAVRVSLGQANILLQRGAYDEAEQLLLGRYRALAADQNGNTPILQTFVQEIVEMYERWERPELAAHYKQLLTEEMPPPSYSQ